MDQEPVSTKEYESLPIFIVVKNGIVEIVFLDQDIEIVVLDEDVGDAPKLADVTCATIGTIAELRSHRLHESIRHLLPTT